MAKVLGILGEDLLRTEGKLAVRESESGVNVAEAAMETAEFELDSLKSVEHIVFNPEVEETVAKKEIGTAIRNVAKNDSQFLNKIWSATQAVSAAAAIALTTDFVYDYMYHHSGPFYTTEFGKKLRIKQPYACGFSLKGGDIVHPLDIKIRKKFSDPCKNYELFDSCGGWATYPRLRQEIDSTTLNALKGKFTCEHASVSDALKALLKQVYTNIFGKTYILGYLMSLVAGIFSFALSKHYGLSFIVSSVIAIFTIVFYFLIYKYIIKGNG